MPPEPPAFVYFDLGNVLFDFDRQRAFAQMSAVCGADPDSIRAVVMEGGLQGRLESGRIGWPEFHEEFSRLTGTTSNRDALAHAASDMFSLRCDILPIIAGLERSGCPIGILSNTCAVHWNHLLAGGYAILPGGFGPIVLSHEVGSMKPASQIYAEATRRAAVPPERIFFCDDLAENVAAARAAGWDAALFTSAAALAQALARRGLTLGL